MASTLKIISSQTLPIDPNAQRLAELKARRADIASVIAANRAAQGKLSHAQAAEALAMDEIRAIADEDAEAMREWAKNGCQGEPPMPDVERRKGPAERLSIAQAAMAACERVVGDLNAEQASLALELAAINVQIEKSGRRRHAR